MSLRQRLPSGRTRVLLCVGVGLLLALNPAYVDLLDLGEERYTYEAVEVVPTDEGLRYESPPPAEVVRVDGVECYFETPPPAACLAQEVLADGGNYTAAIPSTRPPGFVSYVRLDETFYARHYQSRPSGNGTTHVTVQFRRVAPDTMLEAVSVGRDGVAARHRRVVDRGRIQTAEPLAYEPALGPETYRPTGRFVATDDGYYLVGLDGYEPPVPHRELYSLVVAAVGLLGARRGVSRRARSDGATG